MELVRAHRPRTPFVLHPGEFVLGATVERLVLPDDIVARLEGKSSLGRLGLLIHSTAGYVDPGWDGTLTLELSQRREPADRADARDADRADLVHADDDAGRPAVRHARAGQPLSGPGRADAEPQPREALTL